MDYGSAIVTYLILWWLTLFCVLPIGVRTEEEEGGSPEPGHATSAPIRPRLGFKMLLTTGIATVLFLAFFIAVELNLFSFRDLGEMSW